MKLPDKLGTMFKAWDTILDGPVHGDSPTQRKAWSDLARLSGGAKSPSQRDYMKGHLSRRKEPFEGDERYAVVCTNNHQITEERPGDERYAKARGSLACLGCGARTKMQRQVRIQVSPSSHHVGGRFTPAKHKWVAWADMVPSTFAEVIASRDNRRTR